MLLGLLGSRSRLVLWQGLAMSLKAGLRVEDALAQAAHGAGPSAWLARARRNTRRPSLAEAVAALPDRFSELDVALVQAAELAGRLPEVLASLAEYEQERFNERSWLLTRLAYPVFIAHAAAVVGAASPSFSGRGQGDSVVLTIAIALIPFYAITFVLFVLPPLLRRAGAALAVDRFLLLVPFAGRFFRQQAETEFYWLLGTLLQAGIPVREAMSFAVERGSNHAFRADLRPVGEAVNRGEPLSEAIDRSRLLGGGARELVAVAERTGNLPDTLLALFREARERRLLMGRGAASAVWGLYFALAVLYVVWALSRSPLMAIRNLGEP